MEFFWFFVTTSCFVGSAYAGTSLNIQRATRNLEYNKPVNTLHPLTRQISNATIHTRAKKCGSGHCYKICEYSSTSGDYSGTGWIVYRYSTIVAFYSKSANYAFIFDSSQSVVFIINRSTRKSLIFYTSTGIGYFANGSLKGNGIYEGQAILSYIRAIKSIKSIYQEYKAHAKYFKLDNIGNIVGGNKEITTFFRVYWSVYWKYQSAVGIKKWAHFIVSLTRWSRYVVTEYGMYEVSIWSLLGSSDNSQISKYVLEDTGFYSSDSNSSDSDSDSDDSEDDSD